MTVGFRPTCTCQASTEPARVIDPFAGSGTTLLAARKLGLHATGIELNEHYCRMILHRTRQLTLEGAAR